jgi:hypothetical protein
MSSGQPPLPFSHDSGQSAWQHHRAVESHDYSDASSIQMVASRTYLPSTPSAPVPSHSTFIMDLQLNTTQPHEIPGIPINPENDRVTGPFITFLKDKMPFWMMSNPIPPFDQDYLVNCIRSYSRETGDSRITSEFRIPSVELNFVEPFLVDAYKCEHILQMMNNIALHFGDSDEAGIANLICGGPGELDDEKSSSKRKKKRDDSNDTLPSPLYNLHRIDSKSPRTLWMENKFSVDELLRPSSLEFIHGVCMFHLFIVCCAKYIRSRKPFLL